LKRFALLGTVFCMAALLGMGMVVGLAGNAQASECDLGQQQPYIECNAAICDGLPGFHALYWCGTDSLTGEPCACTFTSCIKFCF